MSKQVFYVAHPVSGDPVGNCGKVCVWIAWLTLVDPTRIFIAPWVAEVMGFVNTKVTPEFYDRVLADDQEVVRHCDGIILLGGHVSRGMALELEAARAAGKAVIDWSMLESPKDADTLIAMLKGTPEDTNAFD